MAHITANGRRATEPCGSSFVLSSCSWFPYFSSQLLPASYIHKPHTHKGFFLEKSGVLIAFSCIQDKTISQGCLIASLDSSMENHSSCQYFPVSEAYSCFQRGFQGFWKHCSWSQDFPSAWLQVVIQLSQPHIPYCKEPSNSISTIIMHLFTAVMNQKQNLLFSG